MERFKMTSKHMQAQKWLEPRLRVFLVSYKDYRKADQWRQLSILYGKAFMEKREALIVLAFTAKTNTWYINESSVR